MKNLSQRNDKSFLYYSMLGWLCIPALMYQLDVSMVEKQWRVFLQFQRLLVAGLLICIPRIRKKIPAEGALIAAFFAWNFFTRLVMRDIETGFSASTLYAAEAYGVFCVGFLMEPDYRKKILNWAAGIACGILFIWSVCGLATVLKGSGLPLVRNQIFLMDEVKNGHHLRSLVFFNLHRNETSVWFMLALWMMIYQWFSCGDRRWRWPIAVAGALFYVMVALQHCRTVYIATAGGFAMLAVLLLMPARGAKGAFRKWAIAALVAAACLAVSYMGFSVCDQAVSETAKTTSRIYNQIRGYEQTADEEEEPAFMDDRDLLKDMKTVTGRKSIWRAIYRTRVKDFRIAVFGQRENEVIPLLMEQGGLKFYPGHMHNMFMQALAVNGIVGMFLMLAFVILLLTRMVKLFFRHGVPLVQRFLTIPLTTFLVYGMAESLLSDKTWFISGWFMLLAGIVVAWEQESGAISEKNAEYAQAIL